MSSIEPRSQLLAIAVPDVRGLDPAVAVVKPHDFRIQHGFHASFRQPVPPALGRSRTSDRHLFDRTLFGT